MKILFHTHTLNYRGTTVAVYDYARYNQEILGNESVIAYNAAIPYEKDMGTEDASIENMKKKFEVRSYNSQQGLNDICKDVDLAYFIRSGHPEPLPDNVKTGIHAVFQYNEPHGDVYAYISEWLSNEMSGGKHPWVPHIVSLPSPTDSFRKKLNLEGKTVIGRLGGFYKFDVPFVRKAVEEVLEKDKDIVFLLANTAPFIKHDRVLHISTIIDLQKKSNFINTCDGFLHARRDGESFGLALCESLYHNKPTLAWEDGTDKHHVSLLKDTELLYNEDNIADKILNIKKLKGDFSSIVEKFNPTNVMNKFKEVYID